MYPINIFYLILLLLLLPPAAYTQGVAVNTTGSAADPSAVFDASSTNRGLLIPRMTTTQRDAIVSPATGLLIFNTTTNCFEAWVNSAWNTFSCPAACVPPAPPTANSASGISCTVFTANWSASSGATSYIFDVATDSSFTSFVSGYHNLNVGNVQTQYIASLSPGTTYYYRVRAATACVSANSNTVAAITINNPAVAGTITGTAAVCQGQNGIVYSVPAIADATSYTWSYSGSGFNIASGSGTSSITANFSAGATSGDLTVYGTNTCANGAASPAYTVTVNLLPTMANAGSDINVICGTTSATLAGNSPVVGTGSWSVVSGTATITNPGSPTSGVTSLAVSDTATLRWTISNPPCNTSTDDVVVTTCCFLSGWQYKVPVAINNSTNSNYLSDYQISIVFNHAALVSAGKSKDDASDIRFTDNDCNLLNYWIERGVNSNSCQVWVKVPSIAPSSITNIYLFYGNNTAAAYSNGDSTFILFDDFNGSSLDLTKWIRAANTNPSNSGVSGGYVHIVEDVTDARVKIFSALNTLPYQIRLISKKRVFRSNTYFMGMMVLRSATLDVGVMYDFDNYSGDGCQYTNRDAFIPIPCSTGKKISSFWQNTWFREEMTWDGAASSNNYYLSRFDGTTFQDINTYTAPTFSSNSFYLEFDPYGWWTGHYMDVDYIAVAKFISNEPPASLGTEINY
ncbi:MAG TPA: hypothetical protein DEH02_10785 [Bacteroidales bacterium]|nr:MAG: hypothetical protein A2X01_14800 [Bacteroidetes bacterium GWF2_35_48]HBX51539.1 hypothetical protein [Bacteroidales bacterium]